LHCSVTGGIIRRVVVCRRGFGSHWGSGEGERESNRLIQRLTLGLLNDGTADETGVHAIKVVVALGERVGNAGKTLGDVSADKTLLGVRTHAIRAEHTLGKTLPNGAF
jgi:hypothetical protein